MVAEGGSSETILRAKRGSREAMDVLVRQFMPFILSRVKRYQHTSFYDDVRAHALFGFMQGVMHYELGRGAQIHTYAMRWIDMEVLKCARGFNLRGMQSDDGAAAKRFVGLRRIWEQCGGNIDEYVEAAKAKYPIVSEKEIRDLVPMFEAPQVLFEDVMSNQDEPNSEDQVGEAQESSQRRRALEQAMRALSTRQRAVVEWTMLEGMTLEKVGEHLGVTKERVRQLREQALCKMRQHEAVRRAA